MGIRCPECKTENTSDSQFCKKCATPLPLAEDISVTKTMETPIPELKRGTTFAGRYEIIEELGSGGMGKVYRVFDKEIREEIALKLLRPEVASNVKMIERFKNELKYARKLTHKNICRMYDLNEEDGSYYIAMEYVPGEDLKGFICRTGKLTIEKAVNVAKQICLGLIEAHSFGLVHRDLKPQNIMIDKRGNAHIMDFGVAYSHEGEEITEAGVIIGTPKYMSPEQISGNKADQQSDLYSIGVILYEMATGRVPFEGETGISVAVKHRTEAPPDPRGLNSQIPEDLNRVILKCLEKDKEKRYKNIEEFYSELIRIENGVPVPERIVPSKKPISSKERFLIFKLRKSLIPTLGIVVLIVIVISALLLQQVLRQAHKASIVHKTPTHKQLTFSGDVSLPAISPDGKYIAYVTGFYGVEQRVMVQDIEGGQAIEISQGALFQDLQWLPDSSALSFHAFDTDYGSGIFLVPRLGGTHRKLLSVRGQNPPFTLSPDGSQIVYFDLFKKHFIITDMSTSKTTPIFLNGTFSSLWGLDWSPDGNLLLFRTENEIGRNAIWAIKTDGSKQSKIVEDEVLIGSLHWSPKGDAIYYIKHDELWKILFSPKEGRATKPASSVLGGLQAGGDFTIARDGKQMLYTREISYSNLWQAAVEGTGKNQLVQTTQITRGSYTDRDVSISPDGSLIAFSRGAGEASNIYVLPMEGGTPRQITFFDSDNESPAWSPDGKEIAFGSDYGGSPKVWKVSAQGETPYQFSRSRLGSGLGTIIWAPGTNIIYETSSDINEPNFSILNPTTEEENPLLKDDEAGGAMWNARYSPDGKNIAVFMGWPGRLWIISLEDSSRVLLKEGDLYPLEWTSDGKWIYVLQELLGKIEILMISLDGIQVKSLLAKPYFQEHDDISVLQVAISPDGSHFVYPIRRSHSDVWMVENFDPDVK